MAGGPDVDPTVLGAVLATGSGQPAIATEERPRVFAVTDLRDPIFRPFGSLTANLGQVSVHQSVARARRGLGCRGVVHGRRSRAVGTARRGRGGSSASRPILDRRWNDFPLHPAFVPFVVEAVRYASRASGSERERAVGEAPAGVPPVPGVHQLPDGRQVVLNVDIRESAVSRSRQDFTDMLQRVDAAPARAARLQAQLTESRQGYWQYGLVLMLAVLVAESVIGRAA